MSRQIKIRALELKLQSLKEAAEKEENFILKYRTMKEYEKYRNFLEGYKPNNFYRK